MPRHRAGPRYDSQRSQSLMRVLRVLGELSRSPWALVDLSAHLGIRLRTLYRDVEALRQAGIVIHGDVHEPLYRAERDSVRRLLRV